MIQIPDAPWIRQAEQNGMDEGPDLTCPLCGHGAEYFLINENHEITGCDACTKKIDVWDWLEKYGGGRKNDYEED